MIYVFLANGFEEMEAMAPIDCLRRAGKQVVTVAVGGAAIRSSHGMHVIPDLTEQEITLDDSLEMIVLPGGMPGTLNLGADETVVKTIKRFAAEGKLVAAICAAPSVLGENHILEGKKATCHPGFEEKLLGAQWLEQPVVVDGNVITSRGMGTAIAFALELVRYFTDDATVEHIRQGLVY